MKKSISELTDEQITALPRVTRWRALKRGWVNLPVVRPGAPVGNKNKLGKRGANKYTKNLARAGKKPQRVRVPYSKLKEKGNRTERRTAAFLRSLGYRAEITRRGIFDVIAFGKSEVLLVQVKSNKWPVQAEVRRMRGYPAPPNAIRVIHRWRDGASEPDIRFV